jgi:hypothetical protein
MGGVMGELGAFGEPGTLGTCAIGGVIGELGELGPLGTCAIGGTTPGRVKETVGAASAAADTTIATAESVRRKKRCEDDVDIAHSQNQSASMPRSPALCIKPLLISHPLHCPFSQKSAPLMPSTQTADFAFVLVNYKTPTITPISLDLLKPYAQAHGAVVWVVDNQSSDESTDYLRTLDWIQLIERTPEPGETGTQAHARALDVVMQSSSARYLFLLHTDTFIHNPAILDQMLGRLRADQKLVATGCLDQKYRGVLRSNWRVFSRYFKHHTRRVRHATGLGGKAPKPYREVYLKSFCALWNIDTVKAHGLSFAMVNRVPGYEIQDRLTPQGYRFEAMPERHVFRYLDHIEGGTVVETGGFSGEHRRIKHYQEILARLRAGS